MTINYEGLLRDLIVANNISKIPFVYNLKLNYLSNIKFMEAEEMGEQSLGTIRPSVMIF